MGLLSGIQKIKRNFNSRRAVNKGTQAYAARYKEYSFFGTQCRDERQYEAVITRWYHTIEKGLAYENFRPGFGKNNISSLTAAMEHYIKAGYSTDTFFFQAALSAIEQYIQKNRSYGLETLELEEKVDKVKLAGTKPGGGVEQSLLFPLRRRMYSSWDTKNLSRTGTVCAALRTGPLILGR